MADNRCRWMGAVSLAWAVLWLSARPSWASEAESPFLVLMCKKSVSVAQLPLIDNGRTSVVYRVAAEGDEEKRESSSQMLVGASLGKSEWQQIAASTRGQEVEQAGRARRSAAADKEHAKETTSARPESAERRATEEEDELSDMDVHMRLRYVFVAESAGRIRRLQLDAGQHPAAAPTSGNQAERGRVIWRRSGKSAPNTTNTSDQQQHDQEDAEEPRDEQRQPPDAPATRLALDWLNGLLFVLDQNRLLAMDLEGRNEVTLIDDFTATSRPLQLRLDPVNNFLFWLQRGTFHNAIYKLDLNALTMPATADRLLANAQRLNQRNRSLDDEPLALISHHYAHPIVANLPTRCTLFAIDHRRARILVPYAPDEPEVAPEVARDAEVFAAPDGLTHMNNSLELERDERNCTEPLVRERGHITAFNLDGTDMGPLRNSSDASHLAGLADMRDFSLDHSTGYLYWLTAAGSKIFEEYKVERDDKFYSAEHLLDAPGHFRLIHFQSANQPNASRPRLDLQRLMRAQAASSTANRWTRSGDPDGQDDAGWAHRLSVRARPDHDEASKSPLAVLAVALCALLCCLLVYSLVFQARAARPAPGAQTTTGSLAGSSLAGAAVSLANGGWLTPSARCGTNPVTSSTGVHSATSYDFDSAHYDVSNAVDEHYRDMVDDHGYLNANFSPLAKLTCWPSNLDYLSNKLYVPTEFHQDEALNSINRISIDQLDIESKSPLGEGHFGFVVQGLVSSAPDQVKLEPVKTRVAIKKLKDNASKDEKRDFLQEAKLLASFNHPNIVQLVGICLDRGSTLIIMELMLGGDLTRYMRECVNTTDESEHLTSDDLLAICIDIASGCCYLEEQNFIHRDLAARNCLVSSRIREERVVKLADFGLARDIYKDSYYKKLNDSAMPLKWMAPECLIEQKFTTMSDVWSFGVVMWEVMSHCRDKPYESVSPSFMRNYLEGGKRLAKPADCNDQVYLLMNTCWQLVPEDRPSFEQCKATLIDIRNNLDSSSEVGPQII